MSIWTRCGRICISHSFRLSLIGKRDGWKLSAKEAITRVDLQHIHEQMQTQLTQELGVPVNLLNEATIEGNRSIGAKGYSC